jgi:hypothetical protein
VESFVLKAGRVTFDRRLDRIPHHDPRSLSYPVADLLPSGQPLVPRRWDLPVPRRLDQGQQGACLLFGFTHNRLTTPRPRTLPLVSPAGELRPLKEGHASNAAQWEAFAFRMYARAQQLDEWPGAEPDYSGTSTVAAAKAFQEAGLLGEYRWALGGIDDVLGALSHIGPLVFGTTWLDGMFDTRASGLLEVTGSDAGGHGYAIIGWHENAKRVPGLRGEPVKGPLLQCANSWSPSWGRRGLFYLPVEEQTFGHGAEWLLAKERMGECCIPLDRPAR